MARGWDEGREPRSAEAGPAAEGPSNPFQRAIQEAWRRGAAPLARPEPVPIDDVPDCRVV